MNIIILAGGEGTRLQEETKGLIPKPMIDIGDRPMVDHIMQAYADQIDDPHFFIASGFRGEVIGNWIEANRSDLGRRLNHVVEVPTGDKSGTGYRLKAVHDGWVDGRNEMFLATFGDGLCDISIDALLAFHARMRREYGVLCTLTAARPPSRFGELSITGGMVKIFAEKPTASGGWINGGFYVIEPEALDYVRHPSSSFELDVLPALAQQAYVAAFKHGGWWHMCDTPRDLRFLQETWDRGNAPWTRWSRGEANAPNA